MRLASPTPALVLCVLVSAAAGAAWGQPVYRSVGPDGRVTFSDRPPPDGRESTRVLPSAGARSERGAALPPALQRVAERFPVVLYAAPGCIPCDEGRRMLASRGVPYTESTVTSAEDLAALERLAGERTLPLLGIGGQLLRGWSASQWQQYLDTAGYPSASALPAGWAVPPPAPLAPRAAPATGTAPAGTATPAAPAAAQPVPAPRPPDDGPTPSNPAGIRF